jgi:hypothetical protein
VWPTVWLRGATLVCLQMHDSAPCRLGLATTWSGDLWGLRKELIPWLTYHAYLGISRLYILYEGSDPRALRVSKHYAACRIRHTNMTRNRASRCTKLSSQHIVLTVALVGVLSVVLVC